jgi:hypothetical protein
VPLLRAFLRPGEKSCLLSRGEFEGGMRPKSWRK